MEDLICLICLEEISDDFCFINCQCPRIYHNDCINQWFNKYEKLQFDKLNKLYFI